MEGSLVLLHHLTTAEALTEIEASGALRPTWQAPMESYDVKPYTMLVLWLTADPDPLRFGMKVHEPRTARVTVELDESSVERWECFRTRVRPETTSGLETAAQRHGGDPSDWWVSTAAVGRARWTDVVRWS